MSHWQHEETGYIVISDTRPSHRYYQIPSEWVGLNADKLHPETTPVDCCGLQPWQIDKDERGRFEKWISGPPFERVVTRFGYDPTYYSFPGNYRDYEVQLAWEAWQEALK